MRVTGWVSVIAVCLVTAAALGAYYQYRSVWDSISRVVVTGLGKRPPVYNKALNVLVFGSDNRAALTRHQQVALHVGHVAENSTDTIMVVHISPGRHGVTVISIPRDTQVPVYGCASQGTHQPGQQQSLSVTESINGLLAIGGPSCLWKTVEHQTGIRIDHFIELNLTGFVKVVNDIGGVNVCVPFAVHDPVSGLHLRAGRSHIFGVAALKFWRTREDIGTGSDLQRIQRDQHFMASLMQGVKHSGLLTSPARLVSVVRDVASAMTTDAGLTLPDLLSIASSLRGLSTGSVQFITAPNIPDPADRLPMWCSSSPRPASCSPRSRTTGTCPGTPGRGAPEGTRAGQPWSRRSPRRRSGRQY